MTKKRGIWDTERRIGYDAPASPVVPWRPPAPQPPPAVTWGMRETPASAPDTLESFAVTALQGVVVGLAWGAVATIGAGLATAWQGWGWWVAPVAGLLTCATVTAVHLTSGVSLRQRLLWRREEIERRDLDGDGHIGAPDPEHLVVEVVNHEAKMTQFLHLGIDPGKARTFAQAVLGGGHGLSQAEWSGKGNLFSRSEYERLRAELLRAKLVRWSAGPERKSQGCELTAAGRTVLKKLADSPVTDGGR